MRSWSISAGRVFGVELRIHWTFFFVLPLFVWWTDFLAHHNANEGRGLALVGIIFACVLAHEFGHALVARRAGVRVKSIILLPIGGVTQVDDSQPAGDTKLVPWKRDIRIAMAGPLANLVLALISGLVIVAVAPHVDLWSWPFMRSGNLPGSLVWANLYIAGFNLLPAYPMDGGRVLLSLIHI